eukprot:47488_1
METIKLIDELISHFVGGNDIMDLKSQATLNMFRQNVLECKSSVDKCLCIHRLLEGIKYYMSLDVHSKSLDDKKNTFIEFASEMYQSFLDDYIHITTRHNDELNDILNLMIQQHDIISCDITHCSALLRHYDNNNIINAGVDNRFIFYSNLFDSIHCHLFHSFDVGLRVHQNNEINIQNETTEHYDASFANICDIIQQRTNSLSSVKGLNRNRFSNDKFNLNINIEDKTIYSTDTDGTFIDGLYNYMKQHNIKEYKLECLRNILISEEYDTDALTEDIHDNNGDQTSNVVLELNANLSHVMTTNTSCVLLELSPICICGEKLQKLIAVNCYEKYLCIRCNLCRNVIAEESLVYHCLRNKVREHEHGYDICLFCNETLQMANEEHHTTQAVYQLLRQYRKHILLSGNAFHIGYRFYYWSYYKNKVTNQKENWDEWNKYRVNDKDYPILALLLSQHYNNLKQEILASGFITINQWNDKIVLKCQEWLQTNKVKNIKCKQNNHHGIKYANSGWDEYTDTIVDLSDPISLYHLQCVMLYCDWTNLCTHFSGTFRRKHQFETLQKLRKRHQKYFYFAKGLVEAVNDFGSNDAPTEVSSQRESGPFYCGLSVVLNVPEFGIYLKCPCSTSKDIEIAINFAKRDGIIVQLQNDVRYEGAQQRFFDCSFLSKYSEENERLFISGNYRLRIQSIRIIETAENFETFFHAFYIFDHIISGAKCDSLDKDNIVVSSSDIKILDKLINLSMYNKLDTVSSDIIEYIINTFNLYLSKKTKIEIYIYDLDKYFNNIKHLFINEIVDSGSHEAPRSGNGMILEKIKKNQRFRARSGKCTNINVMKASIFQIFSNLTQVTIYTTYGSMGYLRYQNPTYAFDLLSFLEQIESSKSSIEYIIKASSSRQRSTWLSQEVESYLDDPVESYLTRKLSKASNVVTTHVKQKYNERKWAIKCEKMHEKGDGVRVLSGHCLIIQKMDEN